ncbi:MAG: hypothetical protein ACJAUH_002415 [Saprospiraceae bacterium]|jgi:hypothetical protein
MATKITSIGFVLTILILGIIFQFPLEVTTQSTHRIGVWILTVFVLILFYFLFRQSLRLKHLGLKISSLGFTGLLLLLYLLIGFWSVLPTISSDNYPMFEDTAILTNEDGETIINQFKEISGSLHHSQSRKIIYDFGNGIRISYFYSDRKINGTWTYHQLELEGSRFYKTDTTYIVALKNGRVLK